MQEQQTLQATGWLKEFRIIWIMLGAVAGLGLVIASILGIQALVDEQAVSGTNDSSPSIQRQEDPPLPEGWVDPYFSQPAGIPVQTDPPLPEGWVDPYFSRQRDIPAQEDPPLPEGWVDPYFEGTD